MNLCGIDISCLNIGDILKISDQPKILVTVNAEAIVRAQNDNKLKDIINFNLASIDGQIPLWLFKKKYPNVVIEKISGSDLIYSIPKFAAERKLKVFLLGGKKDSNVGAIKNLKTMFPNLQIEGFSPKYSPYPFTVDIKKEIEKKLSQDKPDILFVGFGMGKQEYWAQDNFTFLKNLGVKLIIGCGGSFEFASGSIRRAPLYIQNSGLEGLWRLLNEFKWFRFKRLLLSTKIFYYYFKNK